MSGAEADPTQDVDDAGRGMADAGASEDASGESASDASAACERGFVLDGARCVRDRCLASADEPAACGEHGECSDGTADVPTCTCNSGYVEEDGQCVRNPCEPLPDEPSPCHEQASCTYEGSGEVTCACNPGYDGDGTSCELNACAQLEGEPPPCAANETCTSTGPAEKTCTCAEGFADCDEDRDNGCEIDTNTHPEHCGACGVTCATGLACREGRCAERVTTMALGIYNSCALSPDGQVLCWGEGVILHEQNLTSSSVPILLDELGEGAELSVGDQAACLIRGQGNQVSCWGSNANHRLGGTNTSARYQDLAIAGVRAVSVGRTHGCAVTGTGRVYCWGEGQLGQLGDGNAYDSNISRPLIELYPVQSVDDAVDVGAGWYISCARTASGAVYCWGLDESDYEPYAPERVRSSGAGAPELTDAASLCVGMAHACALRSTGQAVCWGDHTSGQLGDGREQRPERNVYVEVDLDGIVELACGNMHTCALTETEEVYCWGENRAGQLGTGSTQPPTSNTPLLVEGLQNVVGLYAGSTAEHTCARTGDGRVYCWGASHYGQLGLGSGDGTPVIEPQELENWP